MHDVKRTARDPSQDTDDFQADAETARLDGRIKAKDQRRFAKNRERDAARRRGVHLRALSRLPSHSDDRATNPALQAECHDLFLFTLTQIAQKDLEAAFAECLRACWGLGVAEVAHVLGRSPGHISRLRKRARIAAGAECMD